MACWLFSISVAFGLQWFLRIQIRNQHLPLGECIKKFLIWLLWKTGVPSDP